MHPLPFSILRYHALLLAVLSEPFGSLCIALLMNMLVASGITKELQQGVLCTRLEGLLQLVSFWSAFTTRGLVYSREEQTTAGLHLFHLQVSLLTADWIYLVNGNYHIWFSIIL